jgi:hypothetical protein
LTDKPRFKFEVNLKINRLDGRITVEDPALINDAILDSAWNMMNDFVIDLLDHAGIEATDEQFREVLAEICFKLIYREMFTLFVMPDWEKSGLERLGTRKTGPRINKKGSYDDNWDR